MIVLESPDAANVVAVTKDEHILFVQQYRFGIHAETLELPGGIVDAGEDHATAALRELREETGYTSQHWQHLGSVPSNPVFMTSYIHHHLAEDVEWTDVLKLDEGEALEVVKLPMQEVFQRWRQGGFGHPHTLTALMLFFVKKQFI